MADVTPTRLGCEYLTDPLSVQTPYPRLSWVLESGDRGATQSAYRVLVASSQEILQADKGDLWDSGKVASERSIQVEYAGRPLASGTAAFWKVKAWDGGDRASACSKPATWGMGMLTPSDWKAAWISDPHVPPVDQPLPALPAVMLRRGFILSKPVRRATAYASALGLYELRFNGQRIGDHILAPEWTDYHTRVQYQTYDVTATVRVGDNAIGAHLAAGWYAGRIGISNIVKDGPVRGFYGRHPKLLVQLEIEYEDGSAETIASDAGWKSTTDGPIRRACILDGEVYDARKEQPGWDAPGFDDSAWKPVVVADDVKVQLVAQPNEPIRVTEEIKPIGITEPTPNVYGVDMGQNMAGWCRIRVSGSAGTTVTLRHAEVLEPDGNIYTDNLRMKVHGGELGARQTDQYILRGQGEEVYEPHFTYHGFRYVEITGLHAKPSLDSITGRVFHSAPAMAGTFECSSDLLNRLMRNIVWTHRDNMHSTPTDCPQRDERMGWTGDIVAFAQTACFNMDMAAFFTKWLQDLRDDQADDGRYPDFAPHPYDPNERFSGVPAWGDAGLVVPWRSYVNYGDVRLLEVHYESAKRWVEYVRSQSPEHLWTGNRGHDYGDWLNGNTLILEGWPTEGAEVPKEVLATAFYAHSTGLLSKMAVALGRDEDVKEYAKLADDVKAAFNRAYVKEDGKVEGEAQASYALALDFNLLPDDKRGPAVEHMIAAIDRYKGNISTGFHTTVMLMKELTRAGRDDVAYRLINNRTIPSWGYTIDHGGTTIWERWDGYVEGRGYQNTAMNSFNHYAIGSVGEWMYRSILGINPDEARPGYKHFTIQPRPGGGLTWARGGYDSIHGPIRSEWKIKGGSLTLEVTVPVNTSATVHVPAVAAANVTEGGKPAADADRVEFLRMENGAAIYNVGSGTYRFVSNSFGE